MCAHIILKKYIIYDKSTQNIVCPIYFFEPDLGFLIIFATPLLNVPTISPTSSLSY